eukprot:TRINITY_DN3072_c0_g1_i2.p1 TRINITY_DN3072_c0_g1~~TRINITY_DN3072_c0_g1_i2.p1  ORF type:complete len:111 (+),score=11.03 TRINITY_DN3072_c0_g1_i2:36-335(+)
MSQYEGDKPIEGLSLANNFVASNIVRLDVPGVEGTFLLRNVYSEEDSQNIITRILVDNKDLLSTSKPVLFRGWSENPEEEYKRLGKRVFFRSEVLWIFF